MNNNIQLFNSLQQSQSLNPTGNGNGSAQQVAGNVQPAFPEFVLRDNGFVQARWNVADLAETTMLESDISPPQGADVGANVSDQIAATATAEKKKKNKSASGSRRKQTSPGKVISSSSSNDNDGSGSSSGNGSPQLSTSGAASTSSSSSPSKDEKKASKRSLNAANKPFACEVSGCKKSYVHEFNLAKHMLVVHQGYKADTAANVVVSNDGDGGDAQQQQQQQQLLNIESIVNSSQPSPDKAATPQGHGKRPRLDEQAEEEEEEEEVNEAGEEEAAAEADNAAEQLFSSSDHYQQQQQLGDYASMPNDLLMAFWQGSFLNTPP